MDRFPPEFHIKKITYNDAVKSPRKIHPLDLILFDGAPPRGGDKISGFIKKISKAQTGCGAISHIGLVISHQLLPEIPQLKPDRFYVMESTFSYDLKTFGYEVKTKDAITGNGYFGVQVRDLSQLIQTYNGVIYRGRLLGNPWVYRKNETFQRCQERRNWLIQKFSEFFHQTYLDGYDLNPINLLGTVCPYVRPLRNAGSVVVRKVETLFSNDNPSELICIELVIEAYKFLQILPESVNSKNAIPVDVMGVDADDEIPNLLCPWILQFTKV